MFTNLLTGGGTAVINGFVTNSGSSPSGYSGSIGSCGYGQHMVDQGPKFDNAVRKGRRKKKKKDKYGR